MLTVWWCSYPRVDCVVDLMESTGALGIFLPLYSPDLNAIEEAFSNTKGKQRTQDTLDIESLVLHACTSITEDDWIKHAGYE